MSARFHRLSDVLRAGLVGVALIAAAGSSSSNQRTGHSTTPQQQFASPAPRAMEADRAIGLWRSSFGPVKIEFDASGGDRAVQGAWRYERGGREVIGLFWGALRGNVLDFDWQEPGVGTDLTGKGYLVFDPNGVRFSGKWWTAARDRFGDWNGWRDQPADSGDTGEEPGDDPEGYDDGYDDGYDEPVPGGGQPPPGTAPPPPPKPEMPSN